MKLCLPEGTRTSSWWLYFLHVFLEGEGGERSVESWEFAQSALLSFLVTA
jgi:hypothetical protein